ncbi:hypothetical protein [Kitasatospora sp. NPDC048538]|uniref:hypothetical protein n=1 Tax=unclassified Kitasatospora TaxID=2633591 RepID=UPI0033C4D2F2
MTDDLFASIDALPARPRPVDDLPVPAERERLRKLGEYTQETRRPRPVTTRLPGHSAVGPDAARDALLGEGAAGAT